MLAVEAPTAEYPEEVWQRVLAVNLTGVWLCMKYEIPAMLRLGRGSIVNTSSIVGTVGFTSISAMTAAGIERFAAVLSLLDQSDAVVVLAGASSAT